MKATYSRDADTFRIALDLRPGPLTTEENIPGILVDRNRAGQVVSFTVLSASVTLPKGVLDEVPEPEDKWLSLVEAAAYASAEGEELAAATLRVQIHQGRIPAGVLRKVGRATQISRTGLVNYLESRAPSGRRTKPARKRDSRRISSAA
ncbi:MAG TPA: DUF2283 domain-containing protein [Gemmatimonadales bacterium]|jgi:uncharacterized protein YuzE